MFHEKNFPYKAPEKKVLFVRRHWIIPLKIVIAYLVLFILPLVAWTFLGKYLESFGDKNLLRAILTLGLSTYFLFVWLLLFYALIDYWLDVWIVTTHRILHIEQNGLFNRVIAELELSRIQDLTSSVKGMFATLLGYGTLSIQTAAERPRFIFRYIPNADGVRAKVMELIEERTKEGAGTPI